MKIKFLILALSVLATFVKSQNCYQVLGDQAGFQSTAIVQEMELASCALRDLFPSRFRNDFKVLDFGFYPVNNFTQGNFETIWQDVKKKAGESQNFYLLIGRAASIDGIYSKIFIDIKFPKTHEFDCVTDVQISILRNTLELEANKIKDQSIVQLEKAIISKFQEFLSDKLICCNTGNRSTQCGECLDNESFANYLDQNDFNVSTVENLVKTEYKNTSGNVKEYAKLSFSQNGATIDVNQTVKDLVNELIAVTPNVGAEIQYYKSDSCSVSFNVVESNPFKGFNDLYFYIKAVGINSILGDKFSMKIETNISPDAWAKDISEEKEIQNGIQIIEISVPSTIVTVGNKVAETNYRHPHNPPALIAPDMQSGTNAKLSLLSKDKSKFPTFTVDQLKWYMNELIGWTSMGSLQTEAKLFIEKFITGDGSDYFSPVMSQAAMNKHTTRNFFKRFGIALNDKLKEVNGDLNNVQIFSLGDIRPIYNDNNYEGLRIMMNDTEYSRVYKQSYEFDTKTKEWQGMFYIEVFDHFGLDNEDLIKFQDSYPPQIGRGFVAWWVLQHHKGKKPFRTQMKFLVKLKGKI